ncbi:sulfotransferase 1E1-like [Rhopilema esculentum]|uniref:sulfotransferase 1E1-like n=1 Tax=Rhopilema esculentum TaxID=499914 RepID=UPI0031D9C7D5|eukprot:gene1671-16146_t
MANVQLVPLSDSDTERLKEAYPTPFVKLGQRFVRTVPGNCIMPKAFEKFKDQYKNWEARAEDVYVLTFPKNGTTWVQELAWCLQNNCDIDKAKAIAAKRRVPFLEAPVLVDFLEAEIRHHVEGYLEMVATMDSPRVLKSHLPFCHFPDNLVDKSKVVTCLRNPKDTIVSFFHHEKLLHVHDYNGDFATYFELFMDNLVVFTPYFEYTIEAWKRRDHPNVCLLFYEELKADLAGNTRKVAKFLGKEITEEQVAVLVDHLSFKKMKENISVNHEDSQDRKIMNKEGSFMRKGEVGDWKNYFTEEMNKRMDEAIEKYFKPVGLEFRYE